MTEVALTPRICRSKNVVEKSSRDKISLFCNVPEAHVLSIHDLPNIYHVPKLMIEQNLHSLLVKRLELAAKTPADTKTIFKNPYAKKWMDMTDVIENAKDVATIALVGKYTTQQDSYLSVISALKHSCIATNQQLKLVWVESSHLEEGSSSKEQHEEAWKAVKAADGILVPGGFGIRGIEGKVLAIRYAREAKVPFLGICLGMQVAVIEFTRSFLGRKLANSKEFAPEVSDEDAAIIFMPEGDKTSMGGTMRLGSRRTVLRPGSLACALYGDKEHVDERHRHRYEVNPDLVSSLESKGLIFSGKDENKERMECVELDSKMHPHPYFMAVQFHPEFKSRPMRPSPVFLGFLKAILERNGGRAAAVNAKTPKTAAKRVKVLKK